MILQRINKNNWFQKMLQSPFDMRFINSIIDAINTTHDMATAATLPFKYITYKASASTITKTTSGVLVVGKTYIIANLKAGDDFANVGYVSTGTPFVATDTTPTTWTNSTQVFNVTDLPTITIYATNIVGVISVGYVVNGINVLAALNSDSGEFTDKILTSATAVFVDSNTIKFTLGLPTSVTKIEFYP